MNLYKKLLPVIAAFIMVTIGGCNKPDDGLDGDLTTSIAGHYTSGSGSGLQDIYITRVDDNTVMVTIETSYEDYAFASAEMSTSSAFTLNSIEKTGYGMNYNETVTFTGSGSSSANTVNIILHGVQRNQQGATTDEFDISYSGTK